ncbi:MAG: hypothetical protein AAF340_03465 [Pseudomonadota bacterium]
MKGFDFDHPFFDPLWRRIATFAVCIGWGALEFSTGQNFWGALFWGLGGWAGYHFFVKTPRRDGSEED